ncbi:MAG TPA: Fe-Mn family superoxide dismutase [Polyangiaceae bacterium]
MNRLSRRDALGVAAAGGATLVTGCHAAAPTAPPLVPAHGEVPMPSPRALSATNTVQPLPFKPGSLNGLSERLIVSHHEKNYGGAVKNLNRVEQELSKINADTPPFVTAALRERELTFRNSKTLHEAYFANLGGDGRRSGAIEAAIAEAYGSTAAWETQFRSTAMGLGGGSGWVILALELDTGGLRTYGSGNHTQTLAPSAPLLVLDMYEHSYAIDFGAEHARYIDAFFANAKWDEVNRRLERGRAAAQTLHG